MHRNGCNESEGLLSADDLSLFIFNWASAPKRAPCLQATDGLSKSSLLLLTALVVYAINVAAQAQRFGTESVLVSLCAASRIYGTCEHEVAVAVCLGGTHRCKPDLAYLFSLDIKLAVYIEMVPYFIAGASIEARLKRNRACTSLPCAKRCALGTDRAPAVPDPSPDAARSSITDGVVLAADESTHALAAACADAADVKTVKYGAVLEAGEALEGSSAAEGAATLCSGAPAAAAAAPSPAAAATPVHMQLGKRLRSSAHIPATPGAIASPPLGAMQPGDARGSGAGAVGTNCVSSAPATERSAAAQPKGEHEVSAGAQGAAGRRHEQGPAASLPAAAFYRRWRMSQVSINHDRPCSVVPFVVNHACISTCWNSHMESCCCGSQIRHATGHDRCVQDACSCTCAVLKDVFTSACRRWRGMCCGCWARCGVGAAQPTRRPMSPLRDRTLRSAGPTRTRSPPSCGAILQQCLCRHMHPQSGAVQHMLLMGQNNADVSG